MAARLAEAYATLGLPLGAGIEEVKAAYRQKALQCHPDVAQGTGTEDFICITRAYRQLVSPQPQAAYAGASTAASGASRAYRGGRVWSGSGRMASLVWGFGLSLGCTLFAGMILVSRAMITRSVPAGPTRVVEPSHDMDKRKRIASILLPHGHKEPVVDVDRTAKP